LSACHRGTGDLLVPIQLDVARIRSSQSTLSPKGDSMANSVRAPAVDAGNAEYCRQRGCCHRVPMNGSVGYSAAQVSAPSASGPGRPRMIGRSIGEQTHPPAPLPDVPAAGGGDLLRRVGPPGAQALGSVTRGQRRRPRRMRATYHRRKGPEQFLGFHDVHADCLSGIFRRRKRIVEVSSMIIRAAWRCCGACTSEAQFGVTKRATLIGSMALSQEAPVGVGTGWGHVHVAWGPAHFRLQARHG